MATKKAKWSRKEVLARLWRIAEEARAATCAEKRGKDGEPVIEYDTKCATIELKAVEYAVKLTGLLEEEQGGKITLSISDELKELAR